MLTAAQSCLPGQTHHFSSQSCFHSFFIPLAVLDTHRGVPGAGLGWVFHLGFGADWRGEGTTLSPGHKPAATLPHRLLGCVLGGTKGRSPSATSSQSSLSQRRGRAQVCLAAPTLCQEGRKGQDRNVPCPTRGHEPPTAAVP